MSVAKYVIDGPDCSHKRRGIVRSGDATSGPHAAASVCNRPDCIADAKRWAEATTQLEAEHIPDADAAGHPSPNLGADIERHRGS